MDVDNLRPSINITWKPSKQTNKKLYSEIVNHKTPKCKDNMFKSKA